MKTFHIYILRCSDASYYTGVTSDLEGRLYQHREGIIPTCYTYSRRPIELVYYEDSTDAIAAISREKQIKGWSRAKKEALIVGDIKNLEKLSIAYNERV